LRARLAYHVRAVIAASDAGYCSGLPVPAAAGTPSIGELSGYGILHPILLTKQPPPSFIERSASSSLAERYES
jgi:hypothetical protein